MSVTGSQVIEGKLRECLHQRKTRHHHQRGRSICPWRGLMHRVGFQDHLYIHIYISFLSGCFFSGLYLLVPRFQMAPQADSFPEVAQVEVSWHSELPLTPGSGPFAHGLTLNPTLTALSLQVFCWKAVSSTQLPVHSSKEHFPTWCLKCSTKKSSARL